MQGGDLKKRICNDKAVPRQTGWHRDGKFIILGIARGLLYLHSRGIVWFDCKPGNVFLDHTGLVAKIADFGLAKVLAATSTVGPMVRFSILFLYSSTTKCISQPSNLNCLVRSALHKRLQMWQCLICSDNQCKHKEYCGLYRLHLLGLVCFCTERHHWIHGSRAVGIGGGFTRLAVQRSAAVNATSALFVSQRVSCICLKVIILCWVFPMHYAGHASNRCGDTILWVLYVDCIAKGQVKIVPQSPSAGNVGVDVYGFGCVLWQILTGESIKRDKKRLPR